MGGYETVDKTAQRKKISDFLKQSNSVSFSNIRKKPLPKNRQSLKFSKNGNILLPPKQCKYMKTCLKFPAQASRCSQADCVAKKGEVK